MTNRDKKTFPLWAGLIAVATLSGGLGIVMYSQGVFPLGDRAVEASVAAKKNKLEILLAKASEAAPSGSYTYGGSTTMAPLRQIVEPYIEANIPGFQLHYTEPLGKATNSESGIQMLLDGDLSFSESSRPVKPEEYEAAKEQEFELEQIAVAVDGIAIAVNPELALEGLTVEQLRGIYEGRITNWSTVGGPDLAIQPLSQSPLVSDTAVFFAQDVLDGVPLGRNVEIVRDTTTALHKVADFAGAIYFDSAPEAVSQCAVRLLPLATAEGNPFISPYKLPLAETANCYRQSNQLNAEAFRKGTYPLTRQLFVVVKKNGTAEEEAGRAYADILLTPEGQVLIETAGFIRIQ